MQKCSMSSLLLLCKRKRPCISGYSNRCEIPLEGPTRISVIDASEELNEVAS